MDQPLLYKRANYVQHEDAKKIMQQYAKVIQWRYDGQDTLIDIGCGPADVLMDSIYSFLPKNHELLMGTDISTTMVDYARKYYQAYARTKFQILDIGCEILPKQLSGRFDHVISFYCLHWVQNQRQVLQNVYQLIRCTGGDCLLVFLAKNPIFEVYKILSKVNKWSKYMHDYEQFVSPLQYSEDPAGEYGRLLQEAGFADYSVEIRDEVCVYDGVNIYRDLVKSVCPFFQRIPDVDHDEFLNDYINAVIAMKLSESMENGNDFKFIIPYKLIVAYAHKKDDSFESDVPFLSNAIKESNSEKNIN